MAETARPLEPGGRYVAVGSSFAAGPGVPPTVNRAAGRSGRNYPHQVARALGLRLTDVTFSGATTAHILRDHQRAFAARPVRPQVEAVTADTALVTITVGGNDLGYIGGLMRAGAALAIARRVGRLAPALATRLRERVDLTVDEPSVATATEAMTAVGLAVAERAPGARVMFVDYLTVIGTWELDASGPSRGLPLDTDDRARVARTGRLLADAFAQAAANSGAELVRASVASVDHGVDAPVPWVTGFGGIPRPGTVPYHPTLAGMTAVAELIVGKLRST